MSEKHDQLEERFPLTVSRAEAIKGLDPEPEMPRPLFGLEEAWKKMPLSKRRLIVDGPTDVGRSAARLAAFIIGAECRAQGVPLAVAEKLAAEMPFVADTTPARKVKKQLPLAARKGYHPPDGGQLLTGCCRDPRGASGPSTTRTMMAPYCDSGCAASCPMLRAIRLPERAISDTEYAHIDASELWLHGGGYGEAGRQTYQQLAMLALLDPERNVRATSTYLCAKLSGRYTADHLRTILRRFHEDGLAPIIEKKAADHIVRNVPVLCPERVRTLEQRLGVAGKRASNIRAARNSSRAYHDYVNALVGDVMADWTA